MLRRKFVRLILTLGSPARIHWRQTAEGLRIEIASQKPASDYAGAFKLSLT
jgi:hypothetical protein